MAPTPRTFSLLFFDLREAFELANVLENPLKAPLHIVQSREVNPTLGRDSIRSGINAAIYGTLAVSETASVP